MRRRIPTFSRREMLAGSAGFAALLAGCGRSEGPRGSVPIGRLSETRAGETPVSLTAAEHPLVLADRNTPTPCWLYGNSPFPVLRAKAAEPVNISLANGLKEHTSIHWHGVRVPNAMDGVPYVTQMPVQPGESFDYRFVPPDPGTFFFHPHCNTAEQLGRGLAGILVVEDPEDPAFDDEIVLVLKDWRIGDNGALLPFLTLDGASHAGTFGTLRTANGQNNPRIVVPANADIRLRLVNADSSRVAEIGIDGAKAAIIAIDGNAVEPLALESWRLGPAMRLDLSLRTPEEGGKIRLFDYFAANPVQLASFAAQGGPRRSGIFAPTPLKPARLPEPDLAKAREHQLRLSETAVASEYPALEPIVLPDGSRIDLLDSLCVNTRTLWAVDGKSWPQSGHERLPPPLMKFEPGESAVIELVNATRYVHPMHLHGHTFKVLSSTRPKRPVHWADTVLVMPNERVKIAFVADNPGNWMIHCHIIEHQDTGMMAWFRVG